MPSKGMTFFLSFDERGPIAIEINGIYSKKSTCGEEKQKVGKENKYTISSYTSIFQQMKIERGGRHAGNNFPGECELPNRDLNVLALCIFI